MVKTTVLAIFISYIINHYFCLVFADDIKILFENIVTAFEQINFLDRSRIIG